MPKSTMGRTLNSSIEDCFNFIYLNPPSIPRRLTLEKIIDEYKKGDLYLLPRDVFLKITSECNLRCKHCFYFNSPVNFKADNDFSDEELFDLLDFFTEDINCINFTITGGEPFLHQNILEILKYLKNKNITVTVQTNATLITEKIAKKLSEILNHKTDYFQISLDGVTAETHDMIRGDGNFTRTINGIKNLKKFNLQIALGYTINSLNIHEVSSLPFILNDLRIQGLSLNKYLVCSKEQEYLKPLHSEIFIVVSKLLQNLSLYPAISVNLNVLKSFDFLKYQKGRDLVRQHFLLSKKKSNTCSMCHRHEKITICADGRVCLCTQTEMPELCLGNLREKSFCDIWENRFNNIFFGWRDLNKSVCRNCEFIGFCSTGCPASAYHAYANINAPDGLCFLGRKLMQKINKGASCVKL